LPKPIGFNATGTSEADGGFTTTVSRISRSMVIEHFTINVLGDRNGAAPGVRVTYDNKYGQAAVVQLYGGTPEVHFGGISHLRSQSVATKLQPATQCHAYLKGITIIIPLQSTIGMYWHFISEYLFGIVPMVKDYHPSEVNIVLAGDYNQALFDWFSVLSNNCWRVLFDVPADLCIERGVFLEGRPGGSSAEWVQHVLERTHVMQNAAFGVQATKQSGAVAATAAGTRRPVIGFVSRIDKRVITNEPELAAYAHSQGCDTRRLTLEAWPIHRQVAAIRELDMLVGSHGSGLLNLMFLHNTDRPSACLQVLPVGLKGKTYEKCYTDMARTFRIQYNEVIVQGHDHAMKHWHFVENDLGRLFSTQDVLDRGVNAIQRDGTNRILLIQQDSYVPVDQFKTPFLSLLDSVVAAAAAPAV
jgi:hypothetical protein